MIILGIAIQHDSGAAIVKDGKIIVAVNEERLCRNKLFWGLPKLSIKEVIRIAGIDVLDIDYVAVSNIAHGRPVTVTGGKKEFGGMRNMLSVLSKSPIGKLITGTNVGISFYRFLFKRMMPQRRKELMDYVNSLGVAAPFEFIDHHDAHNASAYFTSGWDSALAISLDAMGDGYCSKISVCKNGKMKTIHKIPFFHSPGYYYSYVTELMGYKADKHEGKVTGLAAHGDPEKTLDIFRKRVSYSKSKFSFVNHGKWGMLEKDLLGQKLKNHSREDIAAGIQKHFEDMITEYVKDAIKKTGMNKLVLSGGVFANVKVNQAVREGCGIKDIFIHPHMGDGGVGAGAALFLWAKLLSKQVPKTKRLDNVYFGPEFTDEEIEKELKKNKVSYKKYNNVEKEIAKLLADGKVVARFNGRMEYGPRALGNRSILYQPTDPSVNDWLNKKLHRCYDKETEILTKSGWKFMKDISPDEVVATLNKENNCLEYQKIQSKTSYKFKGNMHSIKNNRINLLVTPGHNFWVKRKHSNYFEFKKIEELHGIKTYHYQKVGGVHWKSGKSNKCFILSRVKHGNKIKKTDEIRIPIKLWLEFLGYYLSEGWVYNDGHGHYKVCVAQLKNSKNYEPIKNCVKKIPFNSFYDKNTFTFYNKQLYTYLKRFGKAKNKFIPLEFLEMPKCKLRILFDALIRGDGNIRGSGYRYATISKQLADDMQILATKLGFSARISVQKPKKKEHNDLYMVRIGRSSVSTVRSYQITKETYNGPVYCVTVPNHIILVRRGGKSVFCGNTEFMPFAPVILEERAKDYFKKYPDSSYAAEFMTITYDVTDRCKKEAPAVVHVDGTARPQTTSEKINPSYYKIVKEYDKITGTPIVINTSFNMHEEPIVCTPYDAIRAFKLGHLDVLAIGNFIAKN
ncbi:MAG: hypothetical protein ISS36_00525 [Candidatus Aenigmarchaeota archaeon]|nr:hypothetical protein [Candidatus Aenigmarchaeota archaeon]